MEEVNFRMEFYLNTGVDRNDFRTMLFDCPNVFDDLSVEKMNQKVAYLKEFSLNNEDIGLLVAFKSQLMICSIEDRWKPLVKYFYYLGTSKDGMRRILTMKPMIFCVGLENTIVPKVQFLRDISVQEDAIDNVLARFPSLLTYSLYKNICPVILMLRAMKTKARAVEARTSIRIFRRRNQNHVIIVHRYTMVVKIPILYWRVPRALSLQL